jgi:2-aminobenzoylacetyl-CoA thioesterase
MMVFSGTGSVANGLHVCGLSWSPVYLIDAERPILFEAGFTCLWRINEQMIRSALMGREPEMLFLTHVHWDHCGGTAYLKRVFPGLKVAASKKAATIMTRPNALALMKDLSARVIPKALSIEGADTSRVSNEPFLPFDIDVVLQDGQTIKMGDDLTIQVLATPGHTGDHLSYYIPEKKILVATEACGAQDRTGYIVAEFLIDYDMYLRSLKRLATLPVEILCQGHHLVFVGEDTVRDYFARSIREAERLKEHVSDLLRAEKGDVEKVMARIKSEQYDSNPYLKQPEEAYLLNLRARITHLAERFKESY